MTWQLFSPDLPFLNQITVSQVRHGFWEHVLPYAPLVTVVISAFVSMAGIIVTCNLALKARQISEQQKKIAQNKLEIDVFDKRFEIFNEYQEYYNKLIIKYYENINDVFDDFLVFRSMYGRSIFLFDKNDLKFFTSAKNILQEMMKYKILKFKENKIENDPKWVDLTEKFHNENANMIVCFVQYVPDIMNKRVTPTISPASHPEPQPTGPKAILMRLKRAVCEWSRPLQ